MISNAVSTLELLKKHKALLIGAGVIFLFVALKIPSIKEATLHSIGIATRNDQLAASTRLKEVELSLQEIETVLKEIRRDLLIQIITTDSLTVEERVEAYDKYHELGYNSWVSVYYTEKIVPKIIDELRNK